MMFYKDLSLMLNPIYNKQSLFLAELLSRMDDSNIVRLTVNTRREIMKAIGSSTKDELAMARKYLALLSKHNIITLIGTGDYFINPKIAGTVNYHSVIDKKTDRYIKLKYNNQGKREIEVL